MAVATNKYAVGVEAPGHKGLTYDWREPPGSPGNTAGVRAVYRVMPLREALRFKWRGDAHFVTYVVRDPFGALLPFQPRVNKGGLAWLEAQGYTVESHVAAVDIDNPKYPGRPGARREKIPWSDETLGPPLLEEAETQWRTLVPLESAGRYFTSRGWRLVQALDAPVPIARFEAVLRTLLAEYTALGLRVDWACTDWTRHFRCPKVVRNGPTGKRRSDNEPELDMMTERHLEPAPPLADDEEDEDDPDAPARPDGPARPRRPRAPRPARPTSWPTDLPAAWEPVAAPIGAAALDEGVESYHTLCRAVAGALLHKKTPADLVPELVRRIARAAGSRDPEHHAITAKDTVARFAGDLNVEGIGRLRATYPTVARALEAACRAARDRADAKTANPDTGAPGPADVDGAPSADEACAALRGFLEHAPCGVSAVGTECFTPGTLVRCGETYAPIETLEVGMPIETLVGRSTIRHTMVRQYDGPLVVVETGPGFFPLRMTPYHKLYVLRRERCVKPARRNTLCSPGCDRTDCPTSRIPFKPYEGYAIEIVEAHEINEDDCLLFRQPLEQQGTVDRSDAYLRLMGYWLAEGWLIKATRHATYQGIGLGFHEKELDTLIADVAQCATDLNVTHNIAPKAYGHCITITLRSEALARSLLEDCGKGSAEKHLPSWFNRLTPSKQLVVLTALFKGDARIDLRPPSPNRTNGRASEHIRYGTVSRRLALDVRDALLGLGIRCSSSIERGGTDSRGIHSQDSYRILITRRLMARFGLPISTLRRDLRQVDHEQDGHRFTLMPVRSIAHERYTGPVHNLTSSGHDSYLTEAGTSKNCGAGKSHTALLVAAYRAERALVKRAAPGWARDPLNTHTAFSTNTNELAIQHTNALRSLGVPTLRVFSPGSLLDARGQPVCKFPEAARAFADAGLSTAYELCNGQGKPAQACPHRASCAAYRGADGPEKPVAVVGPHALLARLIGEVGQTAHLYIDEPPHAIEGGAFGLERLAQAEAFGGLGARYKAAMRPLLRALLHWAQVTGRVGDGPYTLAEVAAEGLDGVSPGDFGQACAAAGLPRAPVNPEDVLACARGAHLPDAKNTAPPLRWSDVARARTQPAFAAQLGALAGVYTALYDGAQAAAQQAGPVFWIDRRHEQKVVVFKRPNAALYRGLHRDGPTVLLDACIAVHRDVVTHIVGYAPREQTFAARDGAPVARTLLRTRATRRAWFEARVPRWPVLARQLAAALAWAAEDPACASLALVTFLAVRRALDVARAGGLDAPDAKRAVDGWKKADLPLDALAAGAAALGPLLAAWPGELLLGHYGATRGLNHMRHVDALVTLGDPWPDLGDVARDCQYMGIGLDHEVRAEQLCRAELEQSHGRLRACRRMKAARILHIGKVLPTGFSAEHFEERLRTPGPSASPSAMDPEELKEMCKKAGSILALSRIVGCSVSALCRYLNGSRPVPDDVAQRLRTVFM